MTKFEQIGVQYQYEARNKAQALRSYEYSCRCCCEKGMHLDCDRCAIAHTHNEVVAIMDDMAKDQRRKQIARNAAEVRRA